MKKKNSIKRSLIASAVALCLCVLSLIGTTFAWFTDSVTSSGNKIVSGTLKVDLEVLDKEDGWKSVKESNAPIFDYVDWEPGYTDVKILKVENEGSLALKWKAKFVSEDELTALADVIDVYVLPSATELTYPTDRDLESIGYEKVGTVRDFVNTIETTTTGKLQKDEVAYLGLALQMRTSAGNEYQDMDLGGVFDIQIVAAQLESEADSFGPNYDAGLDPATDYMFSGADINKSTTKSGKFELSQNITTSENGDGDRYGYGYEYIIRKGADYILDLNGQTIVHDTVNENANHNAFTYLFVANNPGTKLTINGEGKIYSVNSKGYACAVQGKDGTLVTLNGGDFQVDNGIAVWAGAGSHIVINGGSYANGNATTDHELIYSSGGVIDIYGGFFHNTDGNYTLNVEDRNRATSFINVYGGTYVNFDPSTGGQDPNNIKVADGYMVTSEVQDNGDVWYTVVPVPEGYTAASTVGEVTDALAAGENIVLTKDIEFTEALTVDGDVNIDLNGKKMTTVGLNFTGNVTIKNGTVASGGHTNMVPHLKVSSGTLAMADVTVDVNHHLNANVYWAEATGMEVQDATAVLNNCNIKIDNPTGAQWVYSYGISLNNATVTINGGSITAECEEGTAGNGPTNPNAISAMGESSATLNNVDVNATYYATTVNGHLTINTTDTSVTSADVVDNRGGSHTLNYID